MIKQLFLDMDGTLLNSHGQVSLKNIQAVQQKQIPITLVSARAPMEMADAISRLKLTGPQIAFNGGLIFRQDKKEREVLLTERIKSSSAEQIIHLMKTQFPNISLSCYDLDRWYTEKIDDGIEYEKNLTHQNPIVTAQSLLETDVTADLLKIMLIMFDSKTIMKLQAALLAMNLGDISIQQSGKTHLEITSVNAKKSGGVDYIMQAENLSKEETAAFGDGYNDLPMLNAVGVPIVMGNALPEIKAAGRFVTKTNDEDGVAYGIQNFI